MFGERIDGHITMLQRVVALLRDLILGVTLAITCVIVYFGGNASTLNALDWAKLVFAATSIVLIPTIGFVFGWSIFKLFGESVAPYQYLFANGPMPRGIALWYLTGNRRMTKRQYVSFWKIRKASAAKMQSRQPRAHNMLVYLTERAPKLVVWYRSYPYVLAAAALVLAILLFHRTVRVYLR
jgi:hypothetical protein